MGKTHSKHKLTPVPNPGPPSTSNPSQRGFNDGRDELSGVQETPYLLARALYSYDARNVDELSFKADDYFRIIDNSSIWWRARHCKDFKEGLIPYNYVVIDDGSPSSLEAWFEIPRREAEKYLLLMGNPKGTYIVRPSTDPRNFALSVRHYDPIQNMWMVKHYKIRTKDNGRGFFINPKLEFDCIKLLIRHYEGPNGGLCCPLTKPCPRQHKPPVSFRDIEVNRASIKRISKLGHGNFGDVWLCKWNNVLDVAVKTLRPNCMDRSKFIKEAENMHKMYHPRIVQILGVCTQPIEEEVYIITELMNKGSLYDYLRSEEGQQLRFNDMIDMIAQVSEGMAFVESKNIIHRDLRAANILVNDCNTVKIADFGLAQAASDEDNIYQATEGTKFPIKWTAPEAALDRRFSVKSDVWSFGILIYEIITYARPLYPGMTHRQILDETNRGYRLPNPQGGRIFCPQELYEIMLQCWAANPQNRPTFKFLNQTFEDWTVATEGQYLQEQN